MPSTLEHRFNTPLGEMIAIADESGIRLLDFHDRRDIEKALARFVITPSSSENTDIRNVIEQAEAQIAAYFAGQRQSFDLPLSPSATAFQRKVWDELLTIPYGHTRSYSQQAHGMGSTAAIRAVANANGQNFCSIVIPCHRVVGSGGELRGYGGGLHRKQWLIDHELQHMTPAGVASSLFTLESVK